MKPHGGARRFQDIITASDVTTVLDRSYKADIIIGGTGVMQIYNLGDARRYQVGRTHFIFYNNTPEFVGVQSLAGTNVWHRVPPRARCICALQSNATAEGAWFSTVLQSADPSGGVDLTDDAVGLISTATGAIFMAGQGGAGAIFTNGYNNCNSEAGKQGTYIGRTGTTNAGYAYGRSPAGGGAAINLLITGGARAFEALIALEALSTGAEEYISRQGFFNNATGGAPTRGIYLVYDRTTWGDFWVMRCINAAGNTSTATAVAPTTDAIGGSNWQKLRGEVASAGGRVEFWLDNVQVSAAGGITTNIPSAADSMWQMHGLTKTVGVTQRHIFVDYMRMQSYPTVLR